MYELACQSCGDAKRQTPCPHFVMVMPRAPPLIPIRANHAVKATAYYCCILYQGSFGRLASPRARLGLLGVKLKAPPQSPDTLAVTTLHCAQRPRSPSRKAKVAVQIWASGSQGGALRRKGGRQGWRGGGEQLRRGWRGVAKDSSSRERPRRQSWLGSFTPHLWVCLDLMVPDKALPCG